MRRRGVAAALGVAVAVGIALAVVACRQLVGIGDDPPGEQVAAEAGVCGLPISGSCATCIAASCCPQAAACAGSPSCAPYATCLASCNTDVACRLSCTRDHAATSGGLEAAALLSCVASSCVGSCVDTCGGLDVADTADAAAACEACMATNACASEQKCAASVECVGVALCAQACQGRVACSDTCSSPADAGYVKDLYAWVGQLHGTCRPECVGAGNWACVGHVAIPPPVASATSLTVSLYDLTAGNPVPGIEVQVCAQVGGTCDPPSATSDAHGVAVVSVPLLNATQQGSLTGPSGFLRLAWPADGGPPPIRPELVYWGDPLSQAASSLSIPIVPSADEDGTAAANGIGLDTAHGFLAAGSVDCSTVTAAGVQMMLQPPGDSKTRVLYQSGGTYNTAMSATDETGNALFLNVPPGLVEVVATPMILGTPASRAQVLVQKDTLTIVFMSPTR